MSLSVSAVKAAKAGDVLRDAAVPGLQLRVFPTQKAWYLYYRNRSGVQRKPKIGDWPTLTIEQARAIARKWLGIVAHGGDPSKARQDGLAAPTMVDLKDKYMERHASRKKTGEDDRDLFRLHILPKMGKFKVSDVSPLDVDNFMQKMKTSPIQGNRCLSLLSKSFNLAIKWGWRTDNSCKGAEKFPEKKRRRYLSPEEYKRLAAALCSLESESPYGVACIRVLMLTGARLGEIIGSRRAWLRNGILYLPDSKTGEKEIHIPTAALDIINSIPAIDGTLIGIKSRPTKVWVKALAIAEITDLRIHDLRHSFASEALASGMTLSQIGELLGHASTQTTKRYAHLADTLKKQAALTVANRITERMQ